MWSEKMIVRSLAMLGMTRVRCLTSYIFRAFYPVTYLSRSPLSHTPGVSP